MSKEILWVTVGGTDGPATEDELERIRDALAVEKDMDDYHIFVAGEDLRLFDLDELEKHVEKIRELVEPIE